MINKIDKAICDNCEVAKIYGTHACRKCKIIKKYNENN